MNITSANTIDVEGGSLKLSIAGSQAGAAVIQWRLYSQSLDVASVNANTTAEQDFTVAGLATSDIVFINKPSLSAGLGIANVRVKATDTLSITFVNATAAPIDPAAETYKIFAIRAI